MQRIISNLKKEIGIILLLIVFFITKLSVFHGYNLPIWDEAVYIGMGKYIYSWSHSGLWEPLRPIAWPLILGFFWKIGFNIIVVSKFIALLFASANIFMVYMVGKKLFNKDIAIIASILLMITDVFFKSSTYALTDIPSTFFALLAIYYLVKDKFFISGLFTGISFLFRFPQGIILLVVLIWQHYTKEKSSLMS